MKKIEVWRLREKRVNGRRRKQRRRHLSFTWLGGGRTFLCGLFKDERYLEVTTSHHRHGTLELSSAEERYRRDIPPGLCVGCKTILKKKLREGRLEKVA